MPLNAASLTTVLGPLQIDNSPGPEKVTNGSFTGSATGWTLGAAWAYNANAVNKNADGTTTLSQDVGAIANEIYLLTFTISNWTVGSARAALGGVSPSNPRSGNGTYTEIIKATGTGNLVFTPSNTARFTIDTVSVKRVGIAASTRANMWADGSGGLVIRPADRPAATSSVGLLIGNNAPPNITANGDVGLFVTTDLAEGASEVVGLWLARYGNPSGNYAGTLIGADIVGQVAVGCTVNFTNASIGVRGLAAGGYHSGTGTVTVAEGIACAVGTFEGGNITTGICCHIVNPVVTGGGVLATAIGLQIDAITTGGAVNIGLYVKGGTTYALYVESGNSLFAGDIYHAVGTRSYIATPATAPTDANIIAGALSIYLDEVGHNIKIRVRESGGGYRLATIATV